MTISSLVSSFVLHTRENVLDCKAAVKSSFLSSTKHTLIVLLAVLFFIIYFYVNINLHLIEGACLCVFVLYILHCDILYSAHMGMFPASLLGPIVSTLLLCVRVF